MNKKRKQKLIAIIIFIAVIATAIGLILYALKQNINLFYTPTELSSATISNNQYFRIGGYVKKHSVHFDKNGTAVEFVVTDFSHDIAVQYTGLLPNLFREGQGVVVTGQLQNKNLFVANEVLAKHDEKYLPKSIAEKIAATQKRDQS